MARLTLGGVNVTESHPSQKTGDVSFQVSYQSHLNDPDLDASSAGFSFQFRSKSESESVVQALKQLKQIGSDLIKDADGLIAEWSAKTN